MTDPDASKATASVPASSPAHTYSLKRLQLREKPVLFVDIDGVISLWGFDPNRCPDGTWCQVDGIAHFLSSRAGGHLLDLAQEFELVWCSGWEDRADDYLPHLLGVPSLPHLTFADDSLGHWKLAAVEAHAGDRLMAWVDDDFNDACHAWAAGRAAPTLLKQTDPAIGLDDGVAEDLLAWARSRP